MSIAPIDEARVAGSKGDLYDVFISHKSEYKPWVEWLARALMAQGRSVFLDIWNLVPGESWVEGLHRGLEGCRSAILVATPEVVNSGWVREEYHSLQRRRQAGADFRLVPIVFGDLPSLPFLANLQAVDCRDAARYAEWFYRILCGLDGRESGPRAALPIAVDAPPPLKAANSAHVMPSEAKFVQRVMERIGRPNCPPMMVTSRGRRYQGPVIKALLKRATELYGANGLLHISPPFSEQATAQMCFGELGRQCNFAQATPDATTFTSAFEHRLDQAGPTFLLVTGFENANAACRKDLAGALRTLTEHRQDSFRIVLVGGQRLMEQKYAAGVLSFLSHAAVEEWPHPSVGDLLAWQRQEFPEASLDDPLARSLLDATGGHAGMVRYCLERLQEEEADAPQWQNWCLTCPELWETWHALARDAPDALRAALQRDRFGLAVAWPTDAAARRLYWADLLSTNGSHLAWRAEVVRQVGREVLA